jgi:hypothetical protein
MLQMHKSIKTGRLWSLLVVFYSKDETTKKGRFIYLPFF